MAKITFIKDHKVQQNDGKGPEYKVGETHDLHASYAEKYKRLGYATDFIEQTVEASAAAEMYDKVNHDAVGEGYPIITENLVGNAEPVTFRGKKRR